MTTTGGPAPRTVVVADARPVVAQGLAAALNGRCLLEVAAVSTDADLCAALATDPPEVVLVPVGRDGQVPDLLRCATREAPAGTDVVVVGPCPGASAGRVRAVLPAGVTAPELAEAIAALATRPGTGTVPPVVEPEEPPGPGAPPPELAGLTAREREVLGLLAQGRSTREIAEAMSVSVNTVRTHVNVVLHKLGVHSRLRAVALFTDAGAPAHTPSGDPVRR